jgi:tripartite-type tricarboxylate transporter receptor subunit TctC
MVSRHFLSHHRVSYRSFRFSESRPRYIAGVSRRPNLARLVSVTCLAIAMLFVPNFLQREAMAQARPAQDFYRGKVLTVIVPYGAAGGYEYWAAALKPYLEKTLGVSRIDIVNRPGGGSLVGTDYLYSAKPDGLTIGEVNGGGTIFAQIVKKPGVDFDLTKFGWIGSPNVETPVTASRASSPYKVFADLWKLRGGPKKVVALSAGYGGESYVGAIMPLATFAIPYRVLLAYQGSSAAKAGLLRGDGDIANFGYPVFGPLIQSHNVVPLYVTAPRPSALLPGLPTILQLAQHYKLPKSSIDTIDVCAHAVTMGKDWAAPPGTPAGRLAFLRAAFRKAVENPNFLAAAKKAGRVPGYKSPKEIEQTIAHVIKHKNKFVPYLKKS